MSSCCGEEDERRLVEGFARVVAVEGMVAWLEPETTTSCSGCSAVSGCQSPGGIGTIADRRKARRFSLVNDQNFLVGERIVVGAQEQALVKASFVAYAVPLTSLLVGAVLAQWAFGRDEITIASSLVGLALGFSMARGIANLMRARGSTTLHFIRRAGAAPFSQPIIVQGIDRCKST